MFISDNKQNVNENSEEVEENEIKIEDDSDDDEEDAIFDTKIEVNLPVSRYINLQIILLKIKN